MPYLPYFTEEHDALRTTVRRFVENEVKPYVDEWEEKGEFPREILKRMGDLGFLGLRYPEEVGGQGGDYFAGMVLAEELARCGAGGFPMAVAVQTDMATPPILQFGTPKQIEQFLIPALRGDKLACLGITEPDHGSDVQGIQTRAVRDGDEWVINGSKMYITNGPRADFITLVARTSNERGYKGISLFLVEMDRPGITVSRKLDKVGMRSSDTAELVFEDVRIPADQLLGEEGKGFYHIMWELQGERLVAAAGCIGTMQYIYELALRYAKERRQFGQPIANFQVISHLLAEMATEIEACRQLTYAVAYRFSRGEVPSKEISMAKLATAQSTHWVADRALQIFGGNGYMQEYPIERIWRDTRLNRIGAGTDEIMKEIIAKEMGINA
ncbi:acyl-CoA dehydrogenase family protein [Effusibacillus lacus]|uniref:Acyl-CoA dehydrogenase n=1 Tax=Effusibacillus lacus TaxID=1348429 RepID=A0A292YPL7_9BACL|nr:acyl-CoA dehydrogenase family protein [Effusibacillus lacus]TCS72044.1 acyl-CoA dehydrogenase/citronellyl-CoA dehydrogenase [Effusibacillus lacus]GAX90334.1 acyl-CoA dehydrogenase [Effusibacillus lacus]